MFLVAVFAAGAVGLEALTREELPVTPVNRTSAFGRCLDAERLVGIMLW